MIAIHSTVHPRTVRKLAERATAKGVTLIDAALTQQSIQRILDIKD
jgi:3-hydroxyisobutyrate dehydrogenase-like beta-hydroxyacid dehydrogenase